MKKITVLFLLVFAIAKTQAQNYQISFAGTGASTTVDSIKVENLTQCTDTTLGGSDILHLKGTTGINELSTSADNTIHVYPNPMTGNCSIDFEATSQGKTTIELYDISGKRILQVQELLTKEHQTYSLNGISSGIYTLKIESDKYSYTAKIVSSNATIGATEIKHIETTPGIDKQSTAPNTAKMSRSKSGKLAIDMQYTTGDILKLTGFSEDVYRTIFMLVPTQDTTVTFHFVACTDADSNHYAVVQIGTQIWMAENLKTTKYNTGASIGTTTPATIDISGESTPKYQWAYAGNESNVATYGRLYTWYALNDSRNIAPIGWHVAADSEWTTLTTYLLGDSIAGGKLKENCSTLWTSPNIGASDESGFTALPAGYRIVYGNFVDIDDYCYWWSSTTYYANAWYYILYYDYSNIVKDQIAKSYGISVRCVKDN